MASLSKQLEEQVTTWPDVTAALHRFGGREFRIAKAEIGHVHFWGDLDVPFTRAIRDNLVAGGFAQRHRWVPDSGWITFHMSGQQDLDRALWILRLSYLRYALKRAHDPTDLLRRETKHLQLDTPLVAILEQFVPGSRSKAPSAIAAIE